MGYLSDAEMDTLRIERMIIHLVGNREEPFAPQEEIAVQQEGFFRARIQAEAGDGVHSFVDESEVKPVLEQMAQKALDFAAGGQALAKQFRKMHVRQSIPGAFFVLELRSDVPGNVLYALIKYDYREAVELVDQDGESVLRAIIQAFVKEKRAVQKFCLARITNGRADDMICASDRMKAAPDLTDYFEQYLGVQRERDNRELSKNLNEAVRGTLEDVKDHLPDRNVGKAVHRAKEVLRSRESVSNGDVIDAILHAAGRPEDEDVRSRIDSVTRRRLKRQKLQDVEFKPDPATLKVRPRQTVRTAEGVRVEYPGEELGRSVTRQEDGDGVVIMVRTKKRLIEDGTLPSKTR